MTIDLTATGAAELARTFKQLGIRRVFGLCSDQTNSIFCALALEEIDIIGTRHESGAIHMAEGWARATGKVGVATVTCGPGLTQVGTSLMAPPCGNVQRV